MTGQSVIRGDVWRFGKDVDTDVIVPSQYMRLQPEEYVEHVMEPLDPEFARDVAEGDVIVAEENFGIGSSREHAAIGLKLAGVRAVIAVSFGRIFYRNAFNQGLPALVCDRATVESIEQGHDLEIRVFDGELHNHTTGKQHELEPLPEPLKSIYEAGDAVSYYGT